VQQLDIQLKKIGTVLSTRWVASSFRTVEAVWNNAAHYKVCSDPTSADYKRELGISSRIVSLQMLHWTWNRWQKLIRTYLINSWNIVMNLWSWTSLSSVCSTEMPRTLSYNLLWFFGKGSYFLGHLVV